MARNPLKKDDDKADDKDATTSDSGTQGTTVVKAPDSPGDVAQTEDLREGDVHRHRDAISHNLLGTPQDPVDPISHNRVGPGKAYDGDDDLNVESILESEDELKRQLKALPTERLHILAHAVSAESASR